MSDVCIVGGCGRVGLPLGLVLADAGLDVDLYDLNWMAVGEVERGGMPFDEPGAQETLSRVIGRKLTATTQGVHIGHADTVILAVPTPAEEPNALLEVVYEIQEFMRPEQLLIIRSTVHPGTTAQIERELAALGVDVAYCPERTLEGHALTELPKLPQIVGARKPSTLTAATILFGRITDLIVTGTPEEAELAKLFANAWRYMRFAAANQLAVIAADHGQSFEKVRDLMRFEYPRATDLPRAGLVGGPCLAKDMRILDSSDGSVLGAAALLVNEGMPRWIVAQLDRMYELETMKVGILGMAFKADSDDRRGSASYDLRRRLVPRCEAVLCTDPYVVDGTLLPLETVLAQADVLVVATPHTHYVGLDLRQPVIDTWGITGGSQ